MDVPVRRVTAYCAAVKTGQTQGSAHAQPAAPATKLAVAIPDDFPDFLGDTDVARADSLIVQLLQARREIREPQWKRRH